MKIDANIVNGYAQRYAANLCPEGQAWPYAQLLIASHLSDDKLADFSFSTLDSAETPLILVDNTASGPAKSGVLVTDTQIHYSLPYGVNEERRVKSAFPIDDLDMLDFIPAGDGVDVHINSRHIGWLASLTEEELDVLNEFFRKMFRKEISSVRDESQIQEPASGSAIPSQDDPEMIDKLRAFERHQQAFCLHCGYDGLMGVEKRWLPWYMTWWVILPLLISSVGIVPAIALWWNRASSLKFHLRCPHCNAGLETL